MKYEVPVLFFFHPRLALWAPFICGDDGSNTESCFDFLFLRVWAGLQIYSGVREEHKLLTERENEASEQPTRGRSGATQALISTADFTEENNKAQWMDWILIRTASACGSFVTGVLKNDNWFIRKYCFKMIQLDFCFSLLDMESIVVAGKTAMRTLEMRKNTVIK